MTDHRFCLHPATRAGRADCRKQGSPAGWHYALQRKVEAEAAKVCSACFTNACEYAEGIIREANPEAPEYVLRAMVFTLGRELMPDQNGICACLDHQQLLD